MTPNYYVSLLSDLPLGITNIVFLVLLGYARTDDLISYPQSTKETIFAVFNERLNFILKSRIYHDSSSAEAHGQSLEEIYKRSKLLVRGKRSSWVLTILRIF